MDPQQEPMDCECEANAVNPFLKKALEKDEPSVPLFHKTPSLLAQSSRSFYHHGSLSKGQPYYQGQPYLKQLAHPGQLANFRQPTHNMDPPQEPMEWECVCEAATPPEPMEIDEVCISLCCKCPPDHNGC